MQAKHHTNEASRQERLANLHHGDSPTGAAAGASIAGAGAGVGGHQATASSTGADLRQAAEQEVGAHPSAAGVGAGVPAQGVHPTEGMAGLNTYQGEGQGIRPAGYTQ